MVSRAGPSTVGAIDWLGLVPFSLLDGFMLEISRGIPSTQRLCKYVGEVFIVLRRLVVFKCKKMYIILIRCHLLWIFNIIIYLIVFTFLTSKHFNLLLYFINVQLYFLYFSVVTTLLCGNISFLCHGSVLL